MATAYDILAQGQVGATASTLYTAPAAMAIVRHIKLINVHATNNYSIKVWLNGNADANIWHPQVTLAPGESIEFNGALALGSGDTIQAIAGAASVINYLVTGATT